MLFAKKNNNFEKTSFKNDDYPFRVCLYIYIYIYIYIINKHNNNNNNITLGRNNLHY